MPALAELVDRAGDPQGMPLFRGTPVPVRALFDYLAASYRVDEFLEDFVRRHVVRTKQTGQSGRAVLDGAKTDAGERTVMLPQLLVRALQRHKEGQLQDQRLAGGRWVGPDYLGGETDGFVFTSTIGTRFEPRRSMSTSRMPGDRAGIPAHTFHGLRHDSAACCSPQACRRASCRRCSGTPTHYIIMGRYQHVPDELQRDAANRLDSVLNFGS